MSRVFVTGNALRQFSEFLNYFLDSLALQALGDGPKSEQRQWITLEEQIRVEPALSMTARLVGSGEVE